MANIQFKGNVGQVETGVSKKGESSFISFTVAENFSYFDQSQNDWIEKGTQWHNCIIWVKNNENSEKKMKKIARLLKFIVKGAGVMITGRTSINPAVKEDSQGNKIKYLNPYVNVDDIALTTERLEKVTYKPKSNAFGGAVNDPELQQQSAAPQQAEQQEPPAQQSTPFDGPQNNS